MKGSETAGHLEADQADLAAIGEHQGVAIDDLDHRVGLGDVQGGEGGGIRILGLRGGQIGAQNHTDQQDEKRTAAVSHGGDFRFLSRLHPL